MTPWEIRVGDARDQLGLVASESIDCCVTSPPYWGLRDYGEPDQIGLEETPEEYVDALVGVLNGVRRALRPDGTLWLNLGDCYASDGGDGGQGASGAMASRSVSSIRRTFRKRVARHTEPGPGLSGGRRNQSESLRAADAGRTTPGLKPKDLVGIPWLVAFALQRAGWWLRSDIVWAKPNCMPESVRDRPTRQHEYVFLLSKSERYYYDQAAIAEPHAGRSYGNVRRKVADGSEQRTSDHLGRSVPWAPTEMGRNARTVWTIPTKPCNDAHFAVMPEELARRCVVAGSRPGGLVLDPFAGAGTVGMAATKNGRRFLGIEISESSAEIARRRIAKACPDLLWRSMP